MVKILSNLSKQKAAILLTAALLVTCYVGSLAVQASTYYGYRGAVYAVTDLKYPSTTKNEPKKENDGPAINRYTNSTVPNIKLSSWVENSWNENCTNKKNYSSYGSVTMTYKNLANCKGCKHHLTVSTQAGVIDTAVISGTWTPN